MGLILRFLHSISNHDWVKKHNASTVSFDGRLEDDLNKLAAELNHGKEQLEEQHQTLNSLEVEFDGYSVRIAAETDKGSRKVELSTSTTDLYALREVVDPESFRESSDSTDEILYSAGEEGDRGDMERSIAETIKEHTSGRNSP
ncbi:MAG: hypothetical protein SVV03_02510 [Candidatus Nanohaloarchaea archaeon]|nr:hypothetical protein [Candidatus Nanohaloarchaea archaeon]